MFPFDDVIMTSSCSPVLPRSAIYTRPYITNNPDSKIHGDNMGPFWGRQDPGGPHVGHMNLAIWETLYANDRRLSEECPVINWVLIQLLYNSIAVSRKIVAAGTQSQQVWK